MSTVPKTKDEKLNDLNKKFESSKKSKEDAEINALININFINGKQYIQYNKEKNIIEDIPVDSRNYRETGVFNQMRPLRNTIHSKIKDKIPVPQVVPNTGDDYDMDAAEATNAMLTDKFERDDVFKMLRKAAFDVIDIGPAFFHIKWNPDAGEILMSDINAALGDAAYATSLEDKMDLLNKAKQRKDLKTGDVEIEYVKFFEMHVANPFEQDLDKQPWIIRAKAYNKKELEEIYGKKFTRSEVVSSLTGQGVLEDGDKLQSNLGIANAETIEDVVVLKEYFELPTSKYPNGRYMLFTSEMIIKEDELPYINGEYGKRKYPFVKVYLDTPGRFYSHPFMEDAKEIQKRYNDLRNRKYEYVTKNVHGQLAIQNGAISDDMLDDMNTKPGSIIWYERGFEPPRTLSSNGPQTSDADSELYMLSSEFNMVMGISTLSTEGAPDSSAVRGAGMVQMLMESDLSKVMLIIDSLSDAVIEMSKQVVRLYKQFMTPEEVRYSRFTKNLGTSVIWTQDLLVEQITIKNKARLSTTDARRKQDVMQLMQTGLLNANNMLGPVVTEKLLQQFDTGMALNEITFAGKADLDKAYRENRLIVNNLAEIDADDIDDHNIHYDVHTDFMKSEEYRKIVIANPFVDQYMRKHLSVHQNIVQQQQTRAQAEAMAQQAGKK